MSIKDKKVGFLGAGNMGEAIIKGMLRTGLVPIDFEVDVEARRARLNIPGLVAATGEPIRNPVTGAEHRPDRPAARL